MPPQNPQDPNQQPMMPPQPPAGPAPVPPTQPMGPPQPQPTPEQFQPIAPQPPAGPVPPQPIQPTMPPQPNPSAPFVGGVQAPPQGAMQMPGYTGAIPSSQSNGLLSKKLMLIVASVVVAVIVLIGAFFLLNSQKTNSVSFSSLETVTASDYSVDIPKDYAKVSSDGIDGYFYTDNPKANKEIESAKNLEEIDANLLAAVIIGAQSQRGSTSQVKQVVQANQEQKLIDAFQSSFVSSATSAGKDLKIDSDSVKLEKVTPQQGEVLTIIGTLAATTKNKDGKEVSLKGKIKVAFTENDKVVFAMALAEEKLFDKQENGIDKVLDSLKSE